MVPLVEGMLLERGCVPFADGSAIPVDILLAAMKKRSDDALKDMVRAEKLDFRQFKTLRLLLSLPVGFEETDPSLSFLIQCARDRKNPDGDGSESYYRGPGFEEDGDDEEEERRCLVM